MTRPQRTTGWWTWQTPPDPAWLPPRGLEGPPGETLPPSVTRAGTPDPVLARVTLGPVTPGPVTPGSGSPGPAPAWQAHPAARALIELARESRRTLDKLYTTVGKDKLTRAEVEVIAGPLWTLVRLARSEFMAAGHKGGHGGCPYCELVEDLDDSRGELS